MHANVNGPPTPPSEPIELQIDGGVIYLLLAGLIYGIYTIIKRIKMSNHG